MYILPSSLHYIGVIVTIYIPTTSDDGFSSVCRCVVVVGCEDLELAGAAAASVTGTV